MTEQQLATLMTTVLLPLAAALTGFVIQFLRKKSADLTQQIEDDNLHKYAEMATDAILQAVEFTAQTYVDSLKTAGKFDEAAQKEAFNRAKTVALSIITQESKEILTEVYGDFDQWLDTKIEQQVRQLKIEKDNLPKVKIV